MSSRRFSVTSSGRNSSSRPSPTTVMLTSVSSSLTLQAGQSATLICCPRKKENETARIQSQLDRPINVTFEPFLDVTGDIAIRREQEVPIGGGRYAPSEAVWVVRDNICVVAMTTRFRLDCGSVGPFKMSSNDWPPTEVKAAHYMQQFVACVQSSIDALLAGIKDTTRQKLNFNSFWFLLETHYVEQLLERIQQAPAKLIRAQNELKPCKHRCTYSRRWP